MRHFHEPAGSDDFDDPSGWSRASYNHHPCDDFEPLPDTSSDYRQAAIFHLQIMLACDEFVTGAQDARLAIVAVSICLGWPSTRSLSISNIADQLGVSTSTIARACARFREISGLPAGGFRIDRPGAGLNGDKPAAGRGVGNIPKSPELSHGEIGEVVRETAAREIKLAQNSNGGKSALKE